MSEQKPIQSGVDVFVDWAKACLDEMAANAKVLGSNLDKFDATVRAQAEQSIAQVNQWIADGQNQIRDVQAKGESSVAGAQSDIEAMWTRFQSESDKWVELAKDQQATFQARAQAQVQAWQDVVDTYTRRLTEVHAQNKAQAEAQVEQFKADAQKAQADIKAKVDDFTKAGQTSWAAMSQALEESRKSFAKAIEIAANRFNEAAKR